MQVTELQEKLDEMSILLKEAKDENVTLKESCIQQTSSPPGESNQVEVCTYIQYLAIFNLQM